MNMEYALSGGDKVVIEAFVAFFGAAEEKCFVNLRRSKRSLLRNAVVARVARFRITALLDWLGAAGRFRGNHVGQGQSSRVTPERPVGAPR